MQVIEIQASQICEIAQLSRKRARKIIIYCRQKLYKTKLSECCTLLSHSRHAARGGLRENLLKLDKLPISEQMVPDNLLSVMSK